MLNRHVLRGFVVGVEELKAWDKTDLFTFVYVTKAVYGSLESLKKHIQTEDIKRFIRAGAGNCYHMILHNYWHVKSADIIQSVFKNVLFAIQGKQFIRTEIFQSDIGGFFQNAEDPVRQVLICFLEI